METSFRRALTTSDGDYAIFVTGPAAQGLLIAIGRVVVLQIAARAVGWRRAAVAASSGAGSERL